MANEISEQLKKDIAPPGIKISLLLSVIKPLHAKWIVGLYHHLKADKEIIVNEFRTVGISEAIPGHHGERGKSFQGTLVLF